MLFGTGVRAGGTKKNDKYLKISEPGVYRVRLLGEYHAFLFHWNPDGRKICAKTLEIRNPDYTAEDGSVRRGDYIYKQRDAQGNLVDYSPEQTYCYKCETDESRKRFVINVLEQGENDQLKAESQFPNVRVMEFPYAVYKWLEDFYNQEGCYPSDPLNGPIFEIEVKYPRKPAGQKPEPREIIYEASWGAKGSAPLSQQEYDLLFKGVGNNNKPLVYNLIDEYNPLLNRNSVLNPDAPVPGGAAPGGPRTGGFGGGPQGGFRAGGAPTPNVNVARPPIQVVGPGVAPQGGFVTGAVNPGQPTLVQQAPVYTQPVQAPVQQIDPASAGLYATQPVGAPLQQVIQTPVENPGTFVAQQPAAFDPAAVPVQPVAQQVQVQPPAPVANPAVPSVDDMLASLQQVVQ